MHRLNVTRRALLGAAATTAAALGSRAARAAWVPNRPVEFVVAAGPGGGTDQFARLVQSVMQKHGLLRVPVIVSNKGGGAGTEAFVYGRAAGNDPHKVIFGTNNEWLMPLVTKVGYKFDDLRPVAAMAVDEFILWTHADAPWRTARELIEAMRERGGSFKMGGSQSKDTDHILTRQIERAMGVRVTYVPFKSGGEVAVQLAGGHVDANTNNPQENIGQWRAGRLRPLCVFSPERLKATEKVAGDMAWSDIPTCREAGIPIDSFQMPRTVFLPGRTTDEQVAFYADLFGKVRETEEWRDWLARGSQSDFFLTGTQFADFIRRDEAKYRQQFAEDGWLVEG